MANLKRVWIRSPNFYTGNSGRQLLVIHSSEGAQSYQDLGNFFASASSQVSSHVGIDDRVRGTIGEYVHRPDSAWTAGSWNQVAIQAELCTPSGASSNWSTSTWKSKNIMMFNLADWLREESKATGIPLVSLTESQVSQGKRGVCQHRDLPGQTHTDCGPNFPMAYVMDLAIGGAPSTEEEPVNVFYLQFAINADGSINDDSSIAFTNPEGDGNHKMTVSCRKTQSLRMDFIGTGATVTRTIGYDNVGNIDIPEGCKGGVMHLDEPRTLGEPIAVAIGLK